MITYSMIILPCNRTGVSAKHTHDHPPAPHMWA
jgi:hypothetical protein